MRGGGEKGGTRFKVQNAKKNPSLTNPGRFFLGSFKLSIVVADRDLEI